MFDVYQLLDIHVEKAKGAYVFDKNGQPYLDLYGGHAVISVGHGHPHYKRRIKNQLDKIGFYSNSVKMSIQNKLADKLRLVSGKTDYRLFLCNSGAEANENALKLASFTNKRKKIVSFTNGFHGRTSLSVAVTDNEKIQAPVNQNDAIFLLPFNDLAALERCFLDHGSEISSVIVEGIQGIGGIHEATPVFLQKIRQCCTDYGAAFIADSVQCGYGRSGTFFSHDRAQVDADIYTMAKGMGNGFPIGGILIAPHFEAWHGMLGTTFGGNPLACAAALAVLEIMEKENLMEKAKQKGVYLKRELAKIDGLDKVRGHGLMLGFDAPAYCPDLRKKLVFEKQIFTGMAKPNVIRLLPALNIKKKELDVFIHALKSLL